MGRVRMEGMVGWVMGCDSQWRINTAVWNGDERKRGTMPEGGSESSEGEESVDFFDL